MFLQIMPKPLLFTSTSFIQKNSKEWIQHKSEKNKSLWSLNEIAEDQVYHLFPIMQNTSHQKQPTKVLNKQDVK